ncbi:ENT1-like protein [Mya arenaria]|uniref:ENT1-like protein n=1 Tax=Mya arenaria TaxID=6604 RepID=A0ABY7DMA3_MYAAR|nr:ENT1-like protein [Mya arenaria]
MKSGFVIEMCTTYLEYEECGFVIEMCTTYPEDEECGFVIEMCTTYPEDEECGFVIEMCTTYPEDEECGFVIEMCTTYPEDEECGFVIEMCTTYPEDEECGFVIEMCTTYPEDEECGFVIEMCTTYPEDEECGFVIEMCTTYPEDEECGFVIEMCTTFPEDEECCDIHMKRNPHDDTKMTIIMIKNQRAHFEEDSICLFNNIIKQYNSHYFSQNSKNPSVLTIFSQLGISVNVPTWAVSSTVSAGGDGDWTRSEQPTTQCLLHTALYTHLSTAYISTYVFKFGLNSFIYSSIEQMAMNRSDICFPGVHK